MVKNQAVCSKYDLKSVTSIFTGAAPLGAETAEGLQKIYPTWKIRQGYGKNSSSTSKWYIANQISGLTETCTVVSSSPEPDIWFGSSGSLLPGFAAKIMSPDGVEITEYDQPGELVVQSHSVVLGYLNNEKANAETFIEDANGKGRWMRTGDEAVIRVAPSGNEHVFITDRIKELIKVKVSSRSLCSLSSYLTDLGAPSCAR